MKKLFPILLSLVLLTACDIEDPYPDLPYGEKCSVYDYRQVTIGSQTWMAENYNCSKYDTESEAYKYGIRRVDEIPVPATVYEYTFTPYFAADRKENWDSYSIDYGRGLSTSQIKKLGCLYNWAAAVGVADGRNQVTGFTGYRQGICPNGWRLPSVADYEILFSYIAYQDGKGVGNVGYCLKSTSGWYRGGSGRDSYRFAALPSGFSIDANVFQVGNYFTAWTCDAYSIQEAISCFLFSESYEVSLSNYAKYNGCAVRCIKNY